MNILGDRLECVLGNGNSLAVRVTGDDAAVFHLVDPVAGVRDETIVRHQQERFVASADNVAEKFEGALRIVGIEISRRLVGQDDLRIVRERASDGHSLLFAAEKMTALAATRQTWGRS